MSTDHAWLGEPVQLRQDCLPTKQDIYNHYLYLKKVKFEAGEWRNNTPAIETVRLVVSDVKKLWDKTEIPHILDGRKAEKIIGKLIQRFKSLSKIPVERRSQALTQELACLSDMSVCPHTDLTRCCCPVENQVCIIFLYKLILCCAMLNAGSLNLESLPS